MAALIDPDDANDPIARQFIPDPAELVTQPRERADPIGDDAFSPVEGIVHRYPDRVLLKLVYTCPVYCRFCFRREMVGPKGRPGLTARQRQAAYDYIRGHPEIWEVILTGGDPLVLPASRLGNAVGALAAIDHVKIVRIHSRVPAVAPARCRSGRIIFPIASMRRVPPAARCAPSMGRRTGIRDALNRSTRDDQKAGRARRARTSC